MPSDYRKAQIKCLVFKKVKDNPNIIYSNHMVIKAIKDVLSDKIKETEKSKFQEYFCGNGFEEKPFKTSIIDDIHNFKYASKSPKKLKELMEYVNKNEGTELSLETVGVKLDKELPDTKLYNINYSISNIFLTEQRMNFNDKIKDIVSECTGKAEEQYFHFFGELYQLYENVNLHDATKTNLVEAVKNSISFKEFNQINQMLSNKEWDNEEDKENYIKSAIDKLIMKVTVNYAYEIEKGI